MELTNDQSRLVRILAGIERMDLESVTAIVNIMQADGMVAQLADLLEREKPETKTQALFLMRDLQGIPD